MIRPLYRWKSFWFGVLVIVFLGWAWVRSYSLQEGLAGELRPTQSVGVLQNLGSVRLIVRPTIGLRPGFFSDDVNGTTRIFPAAFYWEIYYFEGIGSITVGEVAHWFLILLFLLPWSGWLAWRWRRMRRLENEKPPPA